MEKKHSFEDNTGSILNENFKIIDYPFNEYLIKIKLSDDNEFIEILEIKINKEFMSYKQKIESFGDHNVEKYY